MKFNISWTCQQVLNLHSSYIYDEYIGTIYSSVAWLETSEFKIKFVYKSKNIKLLITFATDDRYWSGNNITSSRGPGKLTFWPQALH